MHSFADFRRHQFGWDHVLDTNMVVRALGQYLILDFDSSKPSRLDHIDGPVQMHWITEAASTVQDQGQAADCADIDSEPHHLGDGQICLGDALDVAQATATEIECREARPLGELGAEWIEHHRRLHQEIAVNHFTQSRHCLNSSDGKNLTQRKAHQV